jgi:hypothetical protein
MWPGTPHGTGAITRFTGIPGTPGTGTTTTDIITTGTLTTTVIITTITTTTTTHITRTITITISAIIHQQCRQEYMKGDTDRPIHVPIKGEREKLCMQGHLQPGTRGRRQPPPPIQGKEEPLHNRHKTREMQVAAQKPHGGQAPLQLTGRLQDPLQHSVQLPPRGQPLLRLTGHLQLPLQLSVQRPLSVQLLLQLTGRLQDPLQPSVLLLLRGQPPLRSTGHLQLPLQLSVQRPLSVQPLLQLTGRLQGLRQPSMQLPHAVLHLQYRKGLLRDRQRQPREQRLQEVRSLRLRER